MAKNNKYSEFHFSFCLQIVHKQITIILKASIIQKKWKKHVCM